jgi:uncharacterized protein YndB with AHSA1/START domain
VSDLRLERVYATDPETVFDAFTDPDAQKELYADAPDWVVTSTCDWNASTRPTRRPSSTPSPTRTRRRSCTPTRPTGW